MDRWQIIRSYIYMRSKQIQQQPEVGWLVGIRSLFLLSSLDASSHIAMRPHLTVHAFLTHCSIFMINIHSAHARRAPNTSTLNTLSGLTTLVVSRQMTAYKQQDNIYHFGFHIAIDRKSWLWALHPSAKRVFNQRSVLRMASFAFDHSLTTCGHTMHKEFY
jgi:hypothetical protein